MAGEKSRGWSRRERSQGKLRVLTAAATRVNIDNAVEVRRQRSVRQNWQLDSFTYRNTIGELRYAVNFLANCAARMRIYVAALPSTGETDMPVDITELPEVPPELIAACAQAMVDLGNGRTAMAGHLHSVSTNISIAGEGMLLGQEDVLSGIQTWSVRSVSEIVVMNDELMLREGPIDSTGQLGLIPLDPNTTVVSRMWQPDPQFRLLADSPMRAILNECESLLILRRMIRATGRSRLAGRGILLIPDELSITVNNDDNDDPEADPFMDSFADAMMTPITNEGDASAVVPIVFRGPAQFLHEVRLIELGAVFDTEARAVREELVGVIATGLDLPKEIIMGVADLNHWSAWQVDDNTFRHHVEPHVVAIVDCLTGAFLRPYLENSGLDPVLIAEWMPRIMFWYDPTELVTHPDQTANATLLHAALSISDSSYRRVLGFDESDAPTPEEIEIRMIRTMRNWPPNVVMALLHMLDPDLAVPPMVGPPALPGIKPGVTGGVDVPIASLPGAPAVPGIPSVASPTPSAPTQPGPPGEGADATAGAILAGMGPEARASMLTAVRHEFITRFGVDPYAPEAKLVATSEGFKVEPATSVLVFDTPALTAGGKPKPSDKSLRLSLKLTTIDSELRSKLQVAANAALLRQLEKAGGRMRQKVANNKGLRDKIAHSRNEHVLALLGQKTVEATGLTASSLMKSDWDSFKEQFFNWTGSAQKQAVATAAQLGGMNYDDAEAASATAMNDGAAKGWSLLEDAMNALAMHAAYNPDPNVTEASTVLALNPDTLVPTGVIRAAIGVAGGATAQDYGLIQTVSGAMVPAIPLGNQVGGIGTGATIEGMLTDAGLQTSEYQWAHGPSVKPFDPHLALDGVQFSSFTDPALANPDPTFPANQYLMPGDHIGCLCDVTPLWITADDVAQVMADASA
jgi:hypothetical protein